MASPSSDLHGVLVLDKTLGPTSHDAVAVARRALGTREIGHTGTLDPAATGVLVLVVGEATKLVTMLGALDKSYDATIRLGIATHTLDAAGDVTEERAVPALDLARVREVAEGFLGEIAQRPPQVSAIKVDGKSMHKRARAGEQVELSPRQVRLDEVEVLAFDGLDIELRVTCGKGFYVRSLARDLAEQLGTVGHLTALRRTRNGAFSAAGALDFDALRTAARGTDDDRAQARAQLIPFARVCESLPCARIDEQGSVEVRHGKRVAIERLLSPIPVQGEAHFIVVSADGAPLAIIQRAEDALKVVRGFRAL